jgi:hypothetical protein
MMAMSNPQLTQPREPKLSEPLQDAHEHGHNHIHDHHHDHSHDHHDHSHEQQETDQHFNYDKQIETTEKLNFWDKTKLKFAGSSVMNNGTVETITVASCCGGICRNDYGLVIGTVATSMIDHIRNRIKRKTKKQS